MAGKVKETGEARGMGFGERLSHLLSSLWPGRGPRAVQLQLVSRMALGPKQSLALVEADGTRLLIAYGSNAAASMLLLPKAEQAGAERTAQEVTHDVEMTTHAYESGRHAISRHEISRHEISHPAPRMAEKQEEQLPIRRMPGRAS